MALLTNFSDEFNGRIAQSIKVINNELTQQLFNNPSIEPYGPYGLTATPNTNPLTNTKIKYYQRIYGPAFPGSQMIKKDEIEEIYLTDLGSLYGYPLTSSMRLRIPDSLWLTADKATIDQAKTALQNAVSGGWITVHTDLATNDMIISPSSKITDLTADTKMEASPFKLLFDKIKQIQVLAHKLEKEKVKSGEELGM